MPDLSAVKKTLEAQRIELPSWAFGNTGTRFKVFAAARDCPGPRRRRSTTPRRCTSSPASRRASPCTSRGTRSTTTPGWPAYAAGPGVAVGTVNANVFQDDDYMLGVGLQPGPAGPAQGPGPPAGVRRTSWTPPARRTSSCGSRTAPTTPGRTPSPARQDRLAEALDAVYQRLVAAAAADPGVQAVRAVLLHHRRAGLGHRRICTACASVTGPRSAWTPGITRPGTNIEFIVAVLLRAGKLGAFDFNSRFYADDDLMVGRGRPVPAVPHPVRGARGGRVRRRRRASRSCSTSATTSSRRSRRRSAR